VGGVEGSADLAENGAFLRHHAYLGQIEGLLLHGAFATEGGKGGEEAFALAREAHVVFVLLG
jgi:hypothetical protein